MPIRNFSLPRSANRVADSGPISSLHPLNTTVLQQILNALQRTLCGRYFTAGGQWYCSLNGVFYSEHYVEVTAQHVDSGILA